MTFVRESRAFATPPALLAGLAAALGMPAWAVFLALVALLLLLFFRVPRRTVTAGDDMVLAAANGRILRIDEIEDPEIGAGRFRRIVTFLSVFDVHVQRAPVEGEIVRSRYTAGRKIAAFRTHADRVNEQQLTVIRRSNGDLVGVRQIAGLLARRVVCYLETGAGVQRGDLIGLIKFGSRVDLLLPAGYEILVQVGQRLREGSTPVASRGAPR